MRAVTKLHSICMAIIVEIVRNKKGQVSVASCTTYICPFFSVKFITFAISEVKLAHFAVGEASLTQ